MSWADHHKRSEQLASEAQVALLQGKRTVAIELYERAADAEVKALDELDQSKVRTRGISAVSAASLYRKASNLERAEEVAAQWLGVHELPDFAKKQLRGLLRSIWAHVLSAEGNVLQHQKPPTELETASKTVSQLLLRKTYASAGTRRRTWAQAMDHIVKSKECVRNDKPIYAHLVPRGPSIMLRYEVEAA